MTVVRSSLRRAVCGAAAGVLVLALSLGGATADPSADAVAELNELSSQAIQAREAVTAAQRDVEAKVAAQTAADDRHRADLETLTEANAQLAPYQDAVNRLATGTYMSGRGGQMATVLTATSPRQLIEQLALQRVVSAAMADQIEGFIATRDRAAAAATASQRSAADARTAAEQATAVQTDLQAKWKDLLRQIAAAEAQYAALTPQQRAAFDSAVPPPPPPEAPPAPEAAPAPEGPPAPESPPAPEDPALHAMPGEPSLAAAVVDIPEALPVGVANEAGLQPNTVLAARAVSARFPQINTIDGVRPDSKPWHPRGLAIDIMIPNYNSPEGIALGDEILAFAMANAGRLGLQDVIWRGTYYTPAGPQASGYGHYDHVHITTLPRR